MAQAPTYQEIAREKEENNLRAQQMQKQQQVAQESQMLKVQEANPILQEYMNRGLNPINEIENYSKKMINAVMSGEVSPQEFIQDRNVLPEYKQMLQNKLTKPSGLGQLT